MASGAAAPTMMEEWPEDALEEERVLELIGDEPLISLTLSDLQSLAAGAVAMLATAAGLLYLVSLRNKRAAAGGVARGDDEAAVAGDAFSRCALAGVAPLSYIPIRATPAARALAAAAVDESTGRLYVHGVK